MLSYWSQELGKIKAFRVFNRTVELDGLPVGILCFTHTNEGVGLHLLSYAPSNRESNYMAFDIVQTQREQKHLLHRPDHQFFLWGTKVYFGDRSVTIKSSKGSALGTGQLDSDWILAEALRQGWDWTAFEDYYLMDLSLTTMSLEIDFSEMEELLKAPQIRFERGKTSKTSLIEAAFELPIGGIFDDPVVLNLKDYIPDSDEVITIYGLELRDMWKDFETIYEVHRARGTFTEEELENFIIENERNFENYCPRGMCFPVLSYESSPDISIQCFATAYLESLIVREYSNSSSSMGILLKTDGELGRRGYPLKNDVIQYPMSPDADKLKFEVFYVHQRMPMTNVIFEIKE